MPGLWIATVVIALALGGRGQAQTPEAADSLSTAPSLEVVGADTLVVGVDTLVIGADTLVIGADILGQVVAPALGDSLLYPAADSLSQSTSLPALSPAPATSTLMVPGPVPTTSGMPKRIRFAAQRRGYFTARTVWAAGCLGGSFLLYNRGSNYRDKADKLYARYQRETDPAEIESFYQRTTTQDTKGQVYWALSAALAINGLRLLFTHETEVVSSQVSRPSLQMILAPQSLQLRVRKWL